MFAPWAGTSLPYDAQCKAITMSFLVWITKISVPISDLRQSELGQIARGQTEQVAASSWAGSLSSPSWAVRRLQQKLQWYSKVQILSPDSTVGLWGAAPGDIPLLGEDNTTLQRCQFRKAADFD